MIINKIKNLRFDINRFQSIAFTLPYGSDEYWSNIKKANELEKELKDLLFKSQIDLRVVKEHH